jgi:MFS family permease
MPLTILRTSLVNAMFRGAFFLYFVFATGYMKTVGFSGNEPAAIGLIAAVFMLVLMIFGSLLADVINRRTIVVIATAALLISAIPHFYTIKTDTHGDRRNHRFWLRIRLRLRRNPDLLHRKESPSFLRSARIETSRREWERFIDQRNDWYIII